MGRSELSDFSKNRILPVTKHSWIVADRSSISVSTTVDMIQDNRQLAKALTDFHGLVVLLVRLQYQQRITEQTRMLVQEQDQEKRLVESALETLSSAIIKDRRLFKDFRGKPLLDACQMVGTHIGITFLETKTGRSKRLSGSFKKPV